MRKRFKEVAEPEVDLTLVAQNGTAEEFHSAVLSLKDQKLDRYAKSEAQQALKKKLEDLHTGAVNAFKNGRPENLQIILSEPEILETLAKVDQDTEFYIFKSLWDARGNIPLALEKVSADQKQGLLDDVLCITIKHKWDSKDIFIPVLIEQGANANAGKGIPLLRAVEHDCSDAALTLLHQSGGSFEDALYLMRANKWGSDEIDKLKAVAQKITGKPIGEEAQMTREMQRMREEITALRELIETHVVPASSRRVQLDKPSP